MLHQGPTVPPTAPEHHHHGGGASAAARSANSPDALHGAPPGTVLRDLVAQLMAERERTLQYGWTPMNPAAMRERMRPVRQWLLDHPAFVSGPAARAFYVEHQTTLRIIAPSNAAGRKLLRQISDQLRSINP